MIETFHLGLRAKGVMTSSPALFLFTAHIEKTVNTILEVVEYVSKEVRVATRKCCVVRV